jgi:hypothetical protein
MSKAHAQLIADLDNKGVTKAVTAMERDLAAFSTSAAREFRKTEMAHAQMASKLVAKERQMMASVVGKQGIGAQRLGQGVMAGSAVAQSIGSSASAASQLAQSAQMAGAFLGPGGLIVTGLVAAGAALWENNRAQKEMVRLAQSESVIRERTADIAGRQKAFRGDEAVQKETEHLRRVREMGEDSAKLAERRLQLEKDIAAVQKRSDLPDSMKGQMVSNLEDRARAQGALDLQAGARGRAEEMIAGQANPVLERARRAELGLAGRRAEDKAGRAHDRALRAAAGQIADREDAVKRNELGRPADLSGKGLKGMGRDAMERRRDALHGAAKAKEKGLADLSPESIKALVDAFTAGIEKTLAH